MTKQIIFYGAGEHAAKILGDNPIIEVTPTPPSLKHGVCFADADIKKHGSTYLGLPVVPIERAFEEYPFADVYITIADFYANHSVYMNLLKKGFAPIRITNGVRLSCHYLENFIVCGYHEGAFSGKAGDDSGGHSLKSCCSDYGKNNVAYVPIVGNLDEAFNDFINLRDYTINRLNRGEPTKCDGCMELKLLYQPEKPQFSYVIFNELGICNCKCSYCNYQERLGRDASPDADFAQLMGLVNGYGFDKANGIVELCNGEITIHPQKKEIYETVKEYNVMFLTNGLIYDDFIQKKLEDGTGILNLSLDCGTRDTFKRIKGLDSFDRVINNLRKYSINRKGVLNLKYIFLPDINDNHADVDGFINLCHELNVTSAHISHNLCLSYEDYNSEQMITAAKYMLRRLEESSIPFEFYSKNIINKIIGLD